jgi:hypothetical protein
MSLIEDCRLKIEYLRSAFGGIDLDAFAKIPIIIMPGLIRHPKALEFTGFRLSPE